VLEVNPRRGLAANTCVASASAKKSIALTPGPLPEGEGGRKCLSFESRTGDQVHHGSRNGLEDSRFVER